MPLQYQLETLEGLDEAISKLYVQKDGKYSLDVTGHEKAETKDGKIPHARLNQEIEKRKATETALKEVADGFVENVPEEMRDLIPDLPPAAKIKWIRDASAKGIFDPKPQEGIDTKRPGGKPPADFKNMDPRAIMATGYKTK
jgi:hypothetical protein